MQPIHNAAWALLSPNLERHPGKPAYLCGDDALTYAGLAGATARAGAALAASGVRPGDRVCCVLPDGPGAVGVLLGAIWIGACPVPLSTALGPGEYAHVLADSGAGLLVADPGHPAAAAARVPVLACPEGVTAGPQEPPGLPKPHAAGPDDFAFMLYTSGSTGKPKGVPHRHRDMLRPVETLGGLLGLGADDVIFSASKLSFAYGLIASLSLTLGHGATAVLLSGKPGAYALLEAIGRYRPTVFFAVPTLYNMLLRALEPDDGVLDGVRLFYSAGEALPAATFSAWRARTGREICEGIGTTEAYNIFISNRPGAASPGAAGRVAPGFEARLVDEDGRDVPDGQPGLLLVRGEGVAASYWHLPERSRETMLPGGWLRTGDMFVASDGVFVHQGRADDMLKVGGRFVAPRDVENVLLTHPAVAECAVTGCRVEGLERPMAVVVPGEGVTAGAELAGALRRFVRQRLPEDMCPVRVLFVEELPKTSTGKIVRRALRQG